MQFCRKELTNFSWKGGAGEALKRTGKAKEAFAAVGKTLIDQRLLWPIPEDEINNNPAINQEDQNPGY